MTQGKTQTCNLATGLLSHSATQWLSSSTELAGNQPKSQSSYQAGGGGGGISVPSPNLCMKPCLSRAFYSDHPRDQFVFTTVLQCAGMHERTHTHTHTHVRTHTHLQRIKHALACDNNLFGLLLNRQRSDQSSHLLRRLPLGQLPETLLSRPH